MKNIVLVCTITYNKLDSWTEQRDIEAVRGKSQFEDYFQQQINPHLVLQ